MGKKYYHIIFIIFVLVLVLVLVYYSITRNLLSERGKSRNMDIIMWYDIDRSPNVDLRRGPNSWYPLNPSHPDICTDMSRELGFRSTTPLLGLYDISDKNTSRQHLYWLSALGCNGLACDLTNYMHGLISDDYTNEVYHNLEVMLGNVSEINKLGEFEAPKIYTTLRLFGSYADNKDEYDRHISGLEKVIDEMYGLYEKYNDAWYTFDDGTEDANKPFLVIFADGTYLQQWLSEDIYFHDDRFNIRWSNGYIGGSSETDTNGFRYVKSPYWLFVQNEKGKEEDYITYYAKGSDNKVEQMIGWASLYLGGNDWDELNNKINGKTTFERTIKEVKNLRPKALLICRFNYPKAWPQEPQEGISLFASTHIEPNEDFRFLVFDNIAKNVYSLNNWIRRKISKPDPSALSSIFDGDSLKISLDEFPLEYRFSLSRNFDDDSWIYYDINKGISLPKEYANEKQVFFQIRNSFGKSGIVKIKRK